MARVINFTYCDLVTEERISGKRPHHNARGTFSILSYDKEKKMKTFALSFSILGMDLGSENHIVVNFEDDKGDLLYEIHSPIQAMNDPEMHDLPKEHIGLDFQVSLLDVPIKHKGTYATKIYCNGELTGEYPIYARESSEV